MENVRNVAGCLDVVIRRYCMILLNALERDRFIKYLEQEIDATKKLIEQSEKLSIAPYTMKLKIDLEAYEIVLSKLVNVEEMRIG